MALAKQTYVSGKALIVGNKEVGEKGEKKMEAYSSERDITRHLLETTDDRPEGESAAAQVLLGFKPRKGGFRTIPFIIGRY